MPEEYAFGMTRWSRAHQKLHVVNTRTHRPLCGIHIGGTWDLEEDKLSGLLILGAAFGDEPVCKRCLAASDNVSELSCCRAGDI